jgi:regulator of RNase E activity RraA
MVGVAHTLRYLPLREDLFKKYGNGMNAQKRAIEELRPGHVLVMDARRDTSAGTIGDILALRAQQRGAAGVVTDGGLRDSAAVTELGLPVFHGGEHPSVLGRRHVPWDTGVPIACGGALVQPGDLIVGDADGVVVVPPELAEELIADCREQEGQEVHHRAGTDRTRASTASIRWGRSGVSRTSSGASSAIRKESPCEVPK